MVLKLLRIETCSKQLFKKMFYFLSCGSKEPLRQLRDLGGQVMPQGAQEQIGHMINIDRVLQPGKLKVRGAKSS